MPRERLGRKLTPRRDHIRYRVRLCSIGRAILGRVKFRHRRRITRGVSRKSTHTSGSDSTGAAGAQDPLSPCSRIDDKIHVSVFVYSTTRVEQMHGPVPHITLNRRHVPERRSNATDVPGRLDDLSPGSISATHLDH